jgi:glycosyltransferase involved in cell wall biosynthesis
MKIIVPISYFGKSGGYRVLSELANHWVKNGHEVSFLVHTNSDEPYFPTQAKLVWYNNDGKIISGKNIDFKKTESNYFTVTFALYKAINSQNADVVLANQSLTALPVSLSKIKAKKFYYIQAYEPFYYESVKGIKGAVLKFISKVSYKHKLVKIVNSPLYFDYKEIKASKCVFPGLDFSVFKPIDGLKSTTKLIIGCIGRIEVYKGTSYVLEAFQLIKKNKNIDIELHIAFGDRLVECEGIKVVDVKGDAQLAEFYNKVSILIAPGTYQLGAVHYPVIEAMACKTPVITTGYLPANDTNAWLVPIKDSLSIYNQILNIHSNPNLVLSKTNKAFVDVREFEWEIVSDKMIHYFNESIS